MAFMRCAWTPTTFISKHDVPFNKRGFDWDEPLSPAAVKSFYLLQVRFCSQARRDSFFSKVSAAAVRSPRTGTRIHAQSLYYSGLRTCHYIWLKISGEIALAKLTLVRTIKASLKEVMWENGLIKVDIFEQLTPLNALLCSGVIMAQL